MPLLQRANGYKPRDFGIKIVGQQFKSNTLKLTPPTTLEGIEKYIASGLIKGLGPVYASKLVKAFGKDVFSIIEAEPGKLLSIPGIGPMRAEKISSGWAAQRAIRDIGVLGVTEPKTPTHFLEGLKSLSFW